jgi:hypothetical protein
MWALWAELEDKTCEYFLSDDCPSFGDSANCCPLSESPTIDPKNWFPSFVDDISEEPQPRKRVRTPGRQIIFPDYPGEIENRKILISNIHPDTTIDEFHHMMQRFGEIRRVIMDNLHSVTASVEFYDIWDAHALRAWGAKSLKVHDRIWMVRFAPFKTVSDKKKRKAPNVGSIVVFGLNPGTMAETIHSAFHSFGEIREVQMSPGKDTQCFVDFWDLRAAKAARVSLHHKWVAALDAQVSIDFSLPGGFRKIAPKILKDVVPTIERPSRTTLHVVLKQNRHSGTD